MELKIVVDNNMFEDVVEKELRALSTDQIKEIVIAGIKEYLKETDSVKKLFFREDRANWGSSVTYTEPSKLLIEMFRNYDISADVEDIKDEITKVIKNDAANIVQKLFVQALSEALADKLRDSSNFNYMLMDSVSQIMTMRNNG